MFRFEQVTNEYDMSHADWLHDTRLVIIIGAERWAGETTILKEWVKSEFKFFIKRKNFSNEFSWIKYIKMKLFNW